MLVPGTKYKIFRFALKSSWRYPEKSKIVFRIYTADLQFLNHDRSRFFIAFAIYYCPNTVTMDTGMVMVQKWKISIEICMFLV